MSGYELIWQLLQKIEKLEAELSKFKDIEKTD